MEPTGYWLVIGTTHGGNDTLCWRGPDHVEAKGQLELYARWVRNGAVRDLKSVRLEEEKR